MRGSRSAGLRQGLQGGVVPALRGKGQAQIRLNSSVPSVQLRGSPQRHLGLAVLALEVETITFVIPDLRIIWTQFGGGLIMRFGLCEATHAVERRRHFPMGQRLGLRIRLRAIELAARVDRTLICLNG